MDQRKAQLQLLKKARRQAKRKYVTLWKVLSVVLLVLGSLLAVAIPAAAMLDSAVSSGNAVPAGAVPAVKWMAQQLLSYENGSAIVTAVGQGLRNDFSSLLGGHRIPAAIPLATLAAVWVLFAVMLGLWIRGVRRYRKTPGYLDYKTMKRACKEK